MSRYDAADWPAMGVLRLLDGLNLVGADVVEVSPPFDVGGMASIAEATMVFELTCILARQVERRRVSAIR